MAHLLDRIMAHGTDHRLSGKDGWRRQTPCQDVFLALREDRGEPRRKPLAHETI
jgi:hypothetical protein